MAGASSGHNGVGRKCGPGRSRADPLARRAATPPAPRGESPHTVPIVASRSPDRKIRRGPGGPAVMLARRPAPGNLPKIRAILPCRTMRGDSLILASPPERSTIMEGSAERYDACFVREPDGSRDPTPIVPGRADHGTGRGQRPPSRTALRPGTRHRRNGTARVASGGCAGWRTSPRQADDAANRRGPQWAADHRAIVEPQAHADPELKSARRYANLSAAELRQALIDKDSSQDELLSERTLRDTLNRKNYRLKRLQKGKPLNQEKPVLFGNLML